MGVANGKTSCGDGEVECLSVSGDAKLNEGHYEYTDSDDPDSTIAFSEGDGGVVIDDVQGSLGAGSGNMHQLSRMAGTYVIESSLAIPNDTIYFQTPSGNIGCAIWPGNDSTLRCDMKELRQTYRDKPSDCEFSWGSAFEMSATGKGNVICFNDTALNADAPKLDYGKSLHVDNFNCVSEKTGLTCENGAGHGFALSKARQKVF